MQNFIIIYKMPYKISNLFEIHHFNTPQNDILDNRAKVVY